MIYFPIMHIIFNVNNAIIFENIDINKGLILTSNPKGIIQSDGENWYFYTNSNIDEEAVFANNKEDFIENLLTCYPNIEGEFFNNECK